jgi:hypothetical protein
MNIEDDKLVPSRRSEGGAFLASVAERAPLFKAA